MTIVSQTPSVSTRRRVECFHLDLFQVRTQGKCIATLNREEAMLLFADLAVCLSDYINPDTQDVLDEALTMWDKSLNKSVE